MGRYALLILPSTNRVYASAAVAMTRAELAVFNRSVLGDRLGDVSVSTIGGLSYVTFFADRLEGADAAYLANLSSSYALFEVVGELLQPVELHPLDRYDDDLITIQKYSGKTNEQFTKLLLNVCILSSAFARDMLSRKFSVFDPLCGRGTTLNQALMYGFDAAGVDIDQKDFEIYSAFIQTWLKRKRIKHRAQQVPIRRNKQLIARRLRISLAAAKEDYQAGETQHLDVVNADTTRATEFFRAGTVDLVVADAPYGCSTAAGPAPRASRGARSTCCRRPRQVGRHSCAAAARWRCHGTPLSRAARTRPRCCPTPAWTYLIPGLIWPSGIASTRRSCETSSWLGSGDCLTRFFLLLWCTIVGWTRGYQ